LTDELESSYSKTNVSTDGKNQSVQEISLQNLIDEIKLNPTSFSPVVNTTEFTQELNLRPQISWHEISFEVLSHVGDECWRRNLLVTCLRCWWHDSDEYWHILGTLYNEFHSKWILKFLSGKQFACSKDAVMRFSTFETGWVFIWR